MDKYQLISNKLKQYWIWRRCYVYFQDGLHLTVLGQEKIATCKLHLKLLRTHAHDKLTQEEYDLRLKRKAKRDENRKIKKKMLKSVG